MPGPQGPPGDSGFGQIKTTFSATGNQTAFVLGAPPADNNKVVMVVDSMFFYLNKGIISIVGSTVNWDQAGYFAMQNGQAVTIYS